MGGLSAIFRIDGGQADASVLRRMGRAVAHRGAQAREWVEGPVGFEHRRGPASLPDPQPMTWGALTLVLAGRLYNEPELRAALAACGAAPKDETQSAAVLAAYREWGLDCVGRLDGDFAFVLHDAERRRLLCARDILGVKPLFYAFDGRRFLAASEPKQLLAAGVSTDPCDERIAAYLCFDRSLNGGPRTFFRDVQRLPPGHRLVVDRGGLRTEEYWRLDPERETFERTEEAMAARLRELMESAVRRRLPAGPPWACALSGGFDSTSVAALLRRVLDARGIDDPLETFAFEFRDAAADEPEVIRMVAREIRARHHTIYLDQENVFDALPDLLRAGDEPTCDMGLLYIWRKKQSIVAAGAHVSLSGLGGDELFCGRFHHLADLFVSGRWGDLRREIRGVYPVDRSTGKATSRLDLLKRYVAAPLLPRSVKRFVRARLLGESLVGPWIHPDLARHVRLEERLDQGPPRIYKDAYRQDCWEVFRYVLVELTLPIHEALGGALALDTRFPLLDRGVVEYMFAAPREGKIREGQSRILHRKAMEGILPEVVTREHMKKNFNPVLAKQQRANFERETRDLLEQKTLRSEAFVDWTYVRRIHGDFLKGRADAWYPLWFTLNLERWLEQIADAPGGNEA